MYKTSKWPMTKHDVIAKCFAELLSAPLNDKLRLEIRAIAESCGYKTAISDVVTEPNFEVWLHGFVTGFVSIWKACEEQELIIHDEIPPASDFG